MYRKILVPVDGSPTSGAGLREALRLASEARAQLRIVHAVDESVFSSGYLVPEAMDPRTYESLRDMIHAEGARILEAAEAVVRPSGVEYSTQLIETVGGRAAQHILDAARQWQADLIVMGTHGRRGISRLVLGSDAELVLRSSSVPVLFVRSPAEAV
ncbi:MAG: Universal stress protein A [Steroidobacteraceae bacterium]|nr:Universal stress protein A [Steroidobacteraceae bacterium]